MEEMISGIDDITKENVKPKQFLTQSTQVICDTLKKSFYE